MEAITKYKALDGKIFDNKEDCIKYDELVSNVRIIFKSIRENPDDIRFSNGGGYIQHDSSPVEAIKVELLKLTNKYFNKKYTDFLHLGRLLDDSGCNVLYRAYTRLVSIDSTYREWGQPYYALNPSKGKQVEFTTP